MAKKWLFRTRKEKIPDHGWAQDLNLSHILLKILWNRGLSSKNEIDHFLKASLKSLTPPQNWPNIPEAAELIAANLLSGKKMAVWGDYDVDGITATALILDVLEFHGFQVLHHLPDRRSEGYGLNKEHLYQLAKQGCDFLLTVDCGISNNSCIDYAKSLGMTVVVSDHHLPPENLPNAAALINPRMKGDWPCRNLAGVGVSFYLMAAVNSLLAQRTGRHFKMDEVLDLVALGTLADVMDLEGENRTLAKGGLAKMAQPKRPGLSALKMVSGYNPGSSINSDQAVFRLAPRINAAGRMGDPDLALSLLREKDPYKAKQLAQELDECNVRRKAEENRILTEACKQAEVLMANREQAGLVLYGKDWHPGIVGIVASRLVEEYNRPVIVLCQNDDYLKGSGRSLPQFNLYEGLKKVSNFLSGFGGHSQAAGVTIKPEMLENFRSAFSETIKTTLGNAHFQRELLLDGELSFEHVTQDFIRELDLMQPFGAGNPEPVFSSLPLIVKERKYLGHSGEHVLLTLQEGENGRELKAKAWRMAHELGSELVNQTIRIAFTPHIDIYQGIENIDLSIKDWQKA